MPKRKTKAERDLEMLQHEVVARREAAWGMYGAIMRQQNFDREKANLQRAVSRTSSERDRKEAQKKVDDLVNNATHSTTLYIGSGVGCSDPDDFD